MQGSELLSWAIGECHRLMIRRCVHRKPEGASFHEDRSVAERASFKVHAALLQAFVDFFGRWAVL